MRKKRFSVMERRFKAARLYSEGKRQFEIADELGVSDVTVSTDLEFVFNEWKILAARKIDVMKSEKLIEINNLKRWCWDSFKRSIEERKKTMTKVKTGEKGQSDVKGIEQSNMKEESLGDPRYLAGVQWCIEKEIELLAIDDIGEEKNREFILKVIPATKAMARKLKLGDSGDVY